LICVKKGKLLFVMGIEPKGKLSKPCRSNLFPTTRQAGAHARKQQQPHDK